MGEGDAVEGGVKVTPHCHLFEEDNHMGHDLEVVELHSLLDCKAGY